MDMNTIALIKGLAANGGGGSSGGVMLVHIALDGDYWVCDKTASEIWTAIQNGCVSFMFGDSTEGSIYPLKSAENDAGYAFCFGDDYLATATNGTDYPKYAD